MLVKQHGVARTLSTTTDDPDWDHGVLQYPSFEEEATFITSQQESAVEDLPLVVTSDYNKLQGNQFEAYSIMVNCYHSDGSADPLLVIVSGAAGMGKSFPNSA